MGIYTELTKELLQKLEEETEVLWVGGSKPTDTSWNKKFLIFRASRYGLSCSDGPAIEKNKHEYVHQTKFLAVCKERLPKPKDEIKVGDWTVWQDLRQKWRSHYVERIEGDNYWWDHPTNQEDWGYLPSHKCTKLHPYSKGEAKVGDKCVTLVTLDSSLPSLKEGQIVTIEGSYPGFDGAGYIRLEEDPDHQGWNHYQLAPLPKTSQEREVVREKVSPEKISPQTKTTPNPKPCPNPGWLGSWKLDPLSIFTIRWDGYNWRDYYNHKLTKNKIKKDIRNAIKIEPGIDECPQVSPPKERYHIKYPLLAGILD